MSAVGMRCSSQADDARSRAAGMGKSTAAHRRTAQCTGHATLGSRGNSVGVTVSLSAKSLAAVTDLANSAVRLGSEGVQMVENAAKATADTVGEVLDHGVLAGVVGAALVAAVV
jgi:hypothetical protein